MRKVIATWSVVGSLVFISCNPNARQDMGHRTHEDSVKIDSAQKKKFVIALATDSSGLNHIDANGKKQGHWIFSGRMKNLPGYDSNAKVEEGLYRDDMKEGEWVEYNADGSVKSRTTYKDDKAVH